MSSSPLKVLLLEDDAADAKLLQMMLHQAAPDQFQLTVASRLVEAQELLRKGAFDLVLSDLDLPDSRGLSTFLQLYARTPDSTAVVVLSGLSDEAVAATAVQKGAQDYLMKGQTNGALIARSLRLAVERRRAQSPAPKVQAPNRGKVLAVIGAKGGVGATTVALNVASATGRQKKKKVVLCELRPCLGSLAMVLRRTPPPADLSNALALPPEAINAMSIGPHLSFSMGEIRVLYGPQRPEAFKEIDTGRNERPSHH
jgi:DNA-binding response OmpR family regulator